MAATSTGPPMSATPGRLRASPAGVGLAVGDLAMAGMAVAFGQHGPEQPGLGGHLGGQIPERHGRIVAVEVESGPGHRPPGLGPLLPWWPRDALRISAVSRASPTRSRALGSP